MRARGITVGARGGARALVPAAQPRRAPPRAARDPVLHHAATAPPLRSGERGANRVVRHARVRRARVRRAGARACASRRAASCPTATRLVGSRRRPRRALGAAAAAPRRPRGQRRRASPRRRRRWRRRDGRDARGRVGRSSANVSSDAATVSASTRPPRLTRSPSALVGSRRRPRRAASAQRRRRAAVALARRLALQAREARVEVSVASEVPTIVGEPPRAPRFCPGAPPPPPVVAFVLRARASGFPVGFFHPLSVSSSRATSDRVRLAPGTRARRHRRPSA